MQTHEIELLDVETRTRLRSTQILTSLPQIISELLQNSLDAGAHQVEVGVDCEQWSCYVRDDGVGIGKGDLSALGKGPDQARYSTSKATSPESLDTLSTFGFRGEAISSMADLCCLEISSRTSKSRESWSIILKGGKSLYDGPSIRWQREYPGTVVSIRDAFYNLPIRRRSHPNPTKTIDLVRTEIETYALVFPHVSFSLEDTSSCKPGKEQVLRIPKTTSSLATFRHLYGKALVQHVEEVCVEVDEVKMEGFLSLEGAHSKAYQFLYVNRHPMPASDLSRIIDLRFAASSFMKHSYDENGETSLRPATRRSPRKTERKPVYVLNITIPPRNVDNCLDPTKASVRFRNNDAVCAFVSSVIQSFLVRHGFASDRDRPKSRDNSPSPSKRRRLCGGEKRRSASLGALSDRNDEEETEIVRNIAPVLYIRTNEEGDDVEDEMTWTDPNSGKTFTVDRRTGNSYLQGTGPGARVDNGNTFQTAHPRRTLTDTRWFSQDEDDTLNEKSEMPSWIQKALQANQAYALAEPKIPSLNPSSTLLAPPQHEHSCGNQGQHNSATHIELERRFSKTDLRNAEVISQVDRKFIACLIDDGSGDFAKPCDSSSEACDKRRSGKALVLIDQHAADERIRVERLLRELCVGYLQIEGDGVKRKELSPPLPVLLTRHEASRLAKSEQIRKAFDAWGVRFAGDLGQKSAAFDEERSETSDGGYVQIMVSSVPEVVYEKLLVGDELREFVKGFLANLDEDNPVFENAQPASQVETPEAGTFEWFKALRWCPRELLDLVNSKACRGAIMFNDTLTLDQCQRLVRELSETALPFQCAHGRPSLVPLGHVETIGSDSRRCERSRVDWTKLEARLPGS